MNKIQNIGLIRLLVGPFSDGWVSTVACTRATMKASYLQVLYVNLANWHEVAGSRSESKSGAKLELESGLSWAAELGVIEFDGVEAAKFLQGYLTCDTEALPAGQWQPTALCNLKGRVVANGWTCADPQGSVWLLVHHSLVESCLAFLHKYMVFAKAEGHNRTDSTIPIMGVQQVAPENLTPLTLDTRGAADAWLALVHVDQAVELWQQAAELTDASQFNTALINAGLALVNKHSSEQYLPQMLGLANSGAINFDKGCYLGQEIVARAQHRGTVKRQLAKLQWRHNATDPSNWDATELTDANNKSLGKIINGLIGADSSGEMLGIALAVVSTSAEQLPAQVRSSTTVDNKPQAIEFQVSQIEN